MWTELRRRLTYANVMATLAMFLGLAGGAYAVRGIPDQGGVFHGCVSKKTALLRVVRSAGSCHKATRRGRRRDPGEFAIRWNEQGRSGTAGQPGSAGAPGAKGDTGDRGPSDAYEGTQTGGYVQIGSNANAPLASVTVPAGTYVVHGSAWIITVAQNGNVDQALCSARSVDNHAVNGRSQFTEPPVGEFTNANHHEFSGTLNVSTAGPVTLSCSAFPVSGGDPADSVQAAFGDVVLVRVGSLTTNP